MLASCLSLCALDERVRRAYHWLHAAAARGGGRPQESAQVPRIGPNSASIDPQFDPQFYLHSRLLGACVRAPVSASRAPQDARLHCIPWHRLRSRCRFSPHLSFGHAAGGGAVIPRMGISLAKLWNVFSENKEFKIIMVGLDNAGKVSV